MTWSWALSLLGTFIVINVVGKIHDDFESRLRRIERELKIRDDEAA